MWNSKTFLILGILTQKKLFSDFYQNNKSLFNVDSDS